MYTDTYGYDVKFTFTDFNKFFKPHSFKPKDILIRFKEVSFFYQPSN